MVWFGCKSLRNQYSSSGWHRVPPLSAHARSGAHDVTFSAVASAHREVGGTMVPVPTQKGTDQPKVQGMDLSVHCVVSFDPKGLGRAFILDSHTIPTT
jgi:hypothetical protein